MLTSFDIDTLLRMCGLEDMDADLFAVTVSGHDADGRPFGTIRDADDGTVLHHFGRTAAGWLVW